MLRGVKVLQSMRAARAARWCALLLAASVAGAYGAVAEFAGGRVRCEVQGGGEELERMAALAMNTALRTLPAPEGEATLTVRLLPPPPFYKRWFGADAPHGFQSGGEIAVRPEPDNVKLAFRLAHEMAHWLVAETHPQRPPLWLDEGLAQRIGTQAAAAAGRTEKRGLARTPPEGWEKHALAPDELAALGDYGESPDAAAAFYWQAERLVDALFERLGRDDFLVYLDILSTPPVPDWQTPLRGRWWFNDADFDALARAIAPASQSPTTAP